MKLRIEPYQTTFIELQAGEEAGKTGITHAKVYARNPEIGFNSLYAWLGALGEVVHKGKADWPNIVEAENQARMTKIGKIAPGSHPNIFSREDLNNFLVELGIGPIDYDDPALKKIHDRIIEYLAKNNRQLDDPAEDYSKRFFTGWKNEEGVIKGWWADVAKESIPAGAPGGAGEEIVGVAGKVFRVDKEFGACTDYTPPKNEKASDGSRFKGGSETIAFFLQPGDLIKVTSIERAIRDGYKTRKAYEVVKGRIIKRKDVLIVDEKEYDFWIVYEGVVKVHLDREESCTEDLRDELGKMLKKATATKGFTEAAKFVWDNAGKFGIPIIPRNGTIVNDSREKGNYLFITYLDKVPFNKETDKNKIFDILFKGTLADNEKFYIKAHSKNLSTNIYIRNPWNFISAVAHEARHCLQHLKPGETLLQKTKGATTDILNEPREVRKETDAYLFQLMRGGYIENYKKDILIKKLKNNANKLYTGSVLKQNADLFLNGDIKNVNWK